MKVCHAGWVAGPIVLFMFAWITWYCSALLIDCYRYPDVDGEKRNYTYIQAVKRYLGEQPIWCNCAMGGQLGSSDVRTGAQLEDSQRVWLSERLPAAPADCPQAVHPVRTSELPSNNI